MFATLLSELKPIREFLSSAFWLAAFLPTLLFIFFNGLILFLWSWPFHNWAMKHLFDRSALYTTVIFTIGFLGLWIYSYVVAALTPLWIRTLEGKNWWAWIRDPGVEFHRARFMELTKNIENAVKIYVSIADQRPKWKATIANAKLGFSVTADPDPSHTPQTPEGLIPLQALQNSHKQIALHQIEDLVSRLASDISRYGETEDQRSHAETITELITYAYKRSQIEHSRLLTEFYAEYGDQEEIAPTRFGNVGLSAQAYAMRAFRCNITLIWSALRRAADGNANTSKALEDAKSQLDFFVASFWLTLLLAMAWSLIFMWHEEWVGALSSAVLGPLSCWALWYGAAVEQYQALQGLIVASLNSYRFEVISALKLNLPADLMEERELWRAFDLAVGNGQSLNLRYKHIKS
jgi:hypothetical protein